MQDLKCLRCGSELIQGFVVDHTHGGVTASAWSSGEPTKSFWTGLKLGGPVLQIEAYRCDQCGRLELFTAGEKEHLLRAGESSGDHDPTQLLRPSERENA